MINKKVGILTWHYYINFGSALQSFALYSVIKSLGYEAVIVNYLNPRHGNIPNSILSKIKAVVRYVLAYIPKFGKRWHNNPIKFRNRYFEETLPFNSEEEGARICRDISVACCGSDQIWAPNCYNPYYFAHFLDGKKIRKISYAASIGLNDIPANLAKVYRQHLLDFYAIGIREEEGKNLLKKTCNIDSTVVLDPTLLVDVSVYEKMQRKVHGIHKPFLFCYFLNKEHQYKENVERYAHEHNLQIVGVSDKASDAEWMNRLTGLGADHFLWLINNAETIMTDSYHGSIFSLLFHKNLWIFQRFEESNPICQNSRIRQLRNNFNLGQRIIMATSPIDDSKAIDYNYFESRLKELRASSLDFLKKALE